MDDNTNNNQWSFQNIFITITIGVAITVIAAYFLQDARFDPTRNTIENTPPSITIPAPIETINFDSYSSLDSLIKTEDINTLLQALEQNTEYYFYDLREYTNRNQIDSEIANNKVNGEDVNPGQRLFELNETGQITIYILYAKNKADNSCDQTYQTTTTTIDVTLFDTPSNALAFFNDRAKFVSDDNSTTDIGERMIWLDGEATYTDGQTKPFQKVQFVRHNVNVQIRRLKCDNESDTEYKKNLRNIGQIIDLELVNLLIN